VRPIYHKTIFRVDYRPSVTFYDKLYSAAASVKGYPDWWTEGLTLTFQNYAEHCSFRLAHNSTVYTQDLKGNPDTDDQRIRQGIEILALIPKEGDYQRAGLRRMYLAPASMIFGDLVSLVGEKFLAQTTQIKEGICPSPIDVSYVVVFQEASAKVRLAAGPMRRDELPSHLQPDTQNNFPPKERSIPVKDLYSDYPEVSLFTDIDYWREEVNATELLGAYEDALSLHQKLAQNVINYVFGL